MKLWLDTRFQSYYGNFSFGIRAPSLSGLEDHAAVISGMQIQRREAITIHGSRQCTLKVNMSVYSPQELALYPMFTFITLSHSLYTSKSVELAISFHS